MTTPPAGCPTLWIRPRPIHRARAYNHYRCRCEECCEWRRSYDRERWELAERTKEYRERDRRNRP